MTRVTTFLGEAVLNGMEQGRAGRLLGTVANACVLLGQVEKAIGYNERQLVISREIGDRRSEGAALWNLGVDYAKLDLIEKA